MLSGIRELERRWVYPAGGAPRVPAHEQHLVGVSARVRLHPAGGARQGDGAADPATDQRGAHGGGGGSARGGGGGCGGARGGRGRPRGRSGQEVARLAAGCTVGGAAAAVGGAVAAAAAGDGAEAEVKVEAEVTAERAPPRCRRR